MKIINSQSTQLSYYNHSSICKSLNYHRPSPLFYILSPFFIPKTHEPVSKLKFTPFSVWVRYTSVYACTHAYTHTRTISLHYWHTLISETKGTKITNFIVTYHFYKISKMLYLSQNFLCSLTLAYYSFPFS